MRRIGTQNHPQKGKREREIDRWLNYKYEERKREMEGDRASGKERVRGAENERIEEKKC